MIRSRRGQPWASAWADAVEIDFEEGEKQVASAPREGEVAGKCCFEVGGQVVYLPCCGSLDLPRVGPPDDRRLARGPSASSIAASTTGMGGRCHGRVYICFSFRG